MSRIVQCPKCRVLLQEPPPGTPYYQCGSCSTTLQAKHASKVETPQIRDSYVGQTQAQYQNQYQRGVDKLSSANTKSFDSSTGKVSERVGDDYARGGEGSPSWSDGGAVGGGIYGRSARTKAVQHDQFRDSPENVKTDIQGQQQHKTSGQEERGYLPMANLNTPHHQQVGYVFKSDENANASSSLTTDAGSNDRAKTENGETESQSLRDHHQHRANLVQELHRTHSDPVTFTEQRTLTSSGVVVGSGGSPSSLPTSMSVRAPRALKWQARPDPPEKPEVSSPKALDVAIDNRGIIDDDRVISPVGRARPAVEQVKERNWRDLPSLRRHKDYDYRRNGDELPSMRRNPSEGSVSSLGTSGRDADYEASETSSTVDEGERNGSLGMDANAPIPGTTKGVDGMYGPHHTDDKAKYGINGRRQLSWDGTRMTEPSGIAGNNANSFGEPSGSVSGLRKSSSDDYMNMVNEQQRELVVVRHARMSSDPGGHQQYHHKHLQQHHLDPQNQWVTRLKQQQQMSFRGGSNSAASNLKPSVTAVSSPGNNPRPPAVPQYERSPSGSNLPTEESASPGRQLPPKRVNYPPLPPPGAMPHVNCQYCHTLLAVPVNLPPPKSSTQKLRCGACRRVNIFSVPQFSGEQSSTGGGSGSESQYGHSIFASSPDYHDASSNPGFRITSGRSLSATSDELRRSGRMPSDLSDKSLSTTRDTSLGSADVPSDEEVAERIRVTKLESHGSSSHSNHSVSTRDVNSFHRLEDGAAGVRSFSEGHSPASPDYKSRFSRGPLRQGSGSGSSGSARYQPEDRSRFASDRRPSSRVHEEGVTSSDSEGEHNVGVASHGSPQLNNLGHSRHSSHGSGRSDQHGQLASPLHEAEASGKEAGHSEHHRGLKALKGIINFKTSLKELTHRGHKEHNNYSRRVTVNGLPIPDNLVVKAEERAGPIMPGNYWYDERAGFWGVLGDKCEGIIPPHIEEFEQPMSRDCAAGKTDVFVNGRELHERDLERLVKRGLPNVRGKHYMIEINGTVINEMTGEIVRELGGLAPSLDHNKRGAGMKTHHHR
ncbi:hypothetical protein R1sor_020209 [Riccia sorocarpa]|uniref:Zinc-ribbon domain-containing protein n=1 Tax=Riccia sorocarpa TaxID=122646 RepID=A0ABD3IHH4_9MARC